MCVSLAAGARNVALVDAQQPTSYDAIASKWATSSSSFPFVNCVPLIYYTHTKNDTHLKATGCV